MFRERVHRLTVYTLFEDTSSYATVGFNDRDIEAALDAVADAGFPQAEIQGKDPHVSAPVAGKALADFRAQLEARGLRARTMHAPSGRTVLGAPDEEWRRQEVALLERYIGFGGELGITDMVIHPIPSPGVVPNADDPAVPRLIADAVKRSLDELVPAAEQAGIRFNLENLPFDCDYPYRTMKELRPLVDPYPEDQVGLVIDTGHVGILRNDPVDEIMAAGHRLRGTHIHDVVGDAADGDHRVPTHGWLDWDAMLRAFAKVSYPGPWTFEVIRPTSDETPEELAHFTREVATRWGL